MESEMKMKKYKRLMESHPDKVMIILKKHKTASMPNLTRLKYRYIFSIIYAK